MLTPWGYEVDELPDLITVSDFNAATNDRYAGDARIEPAISAASAAIRAWCGWHVAPVLDCTITLDGEAGDIWLPTNALASVTSAKVGGEDVTVTGSNRRGRVRLAHKTCGLGNVEVGYVAGYDVAACPDLMGVVVQRVMASVAMTTYGVSQETAGGVSISYSGSALSDLGSAFLPDSVKAALSTYRLVRSHAA
ncbi:MAG: hypothetical protein IJH42_01175 [Atopobiaceae bacterium]|nr:hypothetical protein [Atopobiaceae bacterium]